MSIQVAFEIRGVTPILWHYDNIKAADELAEWRNDPINKGQSVKGDDRSPPWAWMTYLADDGKNICMPTTYIRSALAKAGAQIKIGKGSGGKSYKELSQTAVMFESEEQEFWYIPLNEKKERQLSLADLEKFKDEKFTTHLQEVKKLGFGLDVRRAALQRSKNIRVRPYFQDWFVRGRCEIVLSAMEFDTLQQLFEITGRGGYGDWRPNSKTPGTWGMAEVELRRIGKPTNGKAKRGRARRAAITT